MKINVISLKISIENDQTTLINVILRNYDPKSKQRNKNKLHVKLFFYFYNIKNKLQIFSNNNH